MPYTRGIAAFEVGEAQMSSYFYGMSRNYDKPMTKYSRP